MARIRSLNPCAPVDEDVATMSLAARYVWAYLPCHADREGRLKDSAFTLRNAILPTDTAEAMEQVLAELAQRRHIIRYEVGGRKFIQIRSFLRHQAPHKREVASQIPAPPGEGQEKPGQGTALSQPSPASVSPSPSIPDPGPVSDPGPVREREPAIPWHQDVGPRPSMVPFGVNSAGFKRVQDAYLNKHGGHPAMAEFAHLAGHHPGGPDGLADEIVAAIKALRNGHPYNRDAEFWPSLENFIVKRLWLDQPTPNGAANGGRAAPARASPPRDLRVGHAPAEVKPRPSGAQPI